MRVAMLVNQYPKTSHSFIRREITALEELGAEVLRYSIRRSGEPLVEPADRAEGLRTCVVLDQGALALALAFARVVVRRPCRTLRAVGLALRMARRSDRGVVAHLAWLLEAAWLERDLARQRIGHLHAHFGTNSAAVALLVEALGGPGYSFTAHGTESFDAPATISLGDKVDRARFVVAVSEWGRAQLLRLGSPGSGQKIHVVRCGLDRAFLEASPVAPPTGPRLVCVARLSIEKGVDLLVEALALLAGEGVEFELVLVGDGDLRPQIEAAVASTGLARRVRLDGWGDAARVRAAIEQAAVLVVPSRAEGLPVVIMEALALRRPVVATAVGGIPELVMDGVSGWLVPPGSARALAEALRTALATPLAQRAALGEQGARRVAERHAARSEARVLLRHFAQALATPRR
ncbi:MAG: glycosyltransferase [Planctomycetes bacterium]|nr:glycosyltransferase [Planctomycetota bacterium]